MYSERDKQELLWYHLIILSSTTCLFLVSEDISDTTAYRPKYLSMSEILALRSL